MHCPDTQIETMSQSTVDQEFARLASQLNDVVQLCSKLRDENRSLLEQQNELIEERARLIEKNETARAKVEQMITRLKSMEANQ